MRLFVTLGIEQEISHTAQSGIFARGIQFEYNKRVCLCNGYKHGI